IRLRIDADAAAVCRDDASRRPRRRRGRDESRRGVPLSAGSSAVTERPLGGTGLMVSALSLGTVSLGTDYGIAAPDGSGRPGQDDAVAVVRHALDHGITLIDTAPAYGDAERIVGLAIADDRRAVVATKVDAGGDVAASIESSRRRLGRDVLDIVQVHSA